MTAIRVKDFGVPLVTLKAGVGTTAFAEKVEPPHFWHSVQWHKAVTAGSPTKRKRNTISLCSGKRDFVEKGIHVRDIPVNS